MATRRKVYEAYSKVGGEVSINEIGIPKASHEKAGGSVGMHLGMLIVVVLRLFHLCRHICPFLSPSTHTTTAEDDAHVQDELRRRE